MNIHEKYMELALQNARAMKGQTDPNPLVGAVIVKDGIIVGIGAHLKAGEPHAEIHAIKMAGEKSKGSTMYVTLEPCSHYGRTGPCANAIVEAGVKKVVIAMLDPNPLVAGNGVKILENANIEVEVGVCQKEAEQLNEVFFKYIKEKMPYVTLKSAVTLDGKIASRTSESKWITSEEAREDVHVLRNENQAILVGVNTIIKDNPQLTTRIPNGRNPIRIIMDSTLRIPLQSKVIQDKEAPTWIFTSKKVDDKKVKELEQLGVKVFMTSGDVHTNPKDVLKTLGESAVSSLLIEGGGEINSAFFEQRLIDKMVIYMAPKLVGGRMAPTFLEGEGLEKMSEAMDVLDMQFSKVGRDFKIEAYLK